MNIKDHINCNHHSCSDINSSGFLVPSKDIEPEKIKILMISEVPPVNRKDYFYFSDESDYMKTTIQAFKDSGIKIDSINDLIVLGAFL